MMMTFGWTVLVVPGFVSTSTIASAIRLRTTATITAMMPIEILLARGGGGSGICR
jgi:hypothetical protein